MLAMLTKVADFSVPCYDLHLLRAVTVLLDFH